MSRGILLTSRGHHKTATAASRALNRNSGRSILQSRNFRHNTPTAARSKQSSSSSCIARLIFAVLVIVVTLYASMAGYSLLKIKADQQATLQQSEPEYYDDDQQQQQQQEQQQRIRADRSEIKNQGPSTLTLQRQETDEVVDEGPKEDDDAPQEEPRPDAVNDNSEDDDDPSETVIATAKEDNDDNSKDNIRLKNIRSNQNKQLWTTSEEIEQHRKAAGELVKENPGALKTVITAYMEPPLQDSVPGTGDRGNFDDDKDKGKPPKFVVPLPLREHTPDDLIRVEYPKVQTCHDMPGKFPIDRGLKLDERTGEAIVWNVGDDPTPPDFAKQEMPYCPVEQDPFLPWIHDVFPSQDGRRIEFVAQNKRRCRTGQKFTENVNRLIPQVTLMQSVSVERITDKQARELAPDLWHPDDEDEDALSPRYRLAPYPEASPDGMYTRFICRFHAIAVSDDGTPPRIIVLGETLSEFPFNYEMVSYRKGQEALLSPKGKDTRLFWASNIRFSCPLPPGKKALQEAIATGDTILENGTPTVFVDLIPIRTSVRYDELYLTEDRIGKSTSWDLPMFDPVKRWGDKNVLPRIEASGRWENIPICLPPEFVEEHKTKTVTDTYTFEKVDVSRKLIPDIVEQDSKPHYLSACLWASAEFKTRGKTKGETTDTLDRLKEWIEFHLLVGFQHFYIYDNSGAHTNETSLASVVDLYPGKVTRIDWPSIVCNNNIPAHDSTGERSSQYAAENSCRTRYGPFTEWMAAFDTDEYFVPMGNFTNLNDVLKKAAEEGTNILSFRSSRGRLRKDKSDEVNDGNAIEKSDKSLFLEAYNCDSAGSPKPSWADRARKQIYRTDYVLYHYVHYSTVTRGITESFKQAKENGRVWTRRFGEHPPSERVTDEILEAVMIHTKSLRGDMTSNYKSRCKYDYKKKWHGCWVASPWPPGSDTTVEDAHDEEGFEYNCHINQRVENYWVPKLREALGKRRRGKRF